MPATEILSSATTRSAFLQSLQRSREREERREKGLEFERQSDREKGIEFERQRNHDNKYDSKHDSGNYDSVNNYDNSQKYELPAQTQNDHSSTPIMSRRRLSSSPAKSTVSTPIKPLNSATPVSQSKLASHAFTMSRSSTEDEIDRKEQLMNFSSEFSMSDFKRKYEEEFNNNKKMSENLASTKSAGYQSPKQEEGYKFSNEHINDRTDIKSMAKSQSYNDLKSRDISDFKPRDISNIKTSDISDLKSLIDSVVESHTISLKNDLQNLHIELIKQSVAQQSAFRSLLETYLPLTGKLMESLKEEREENGRLKMRIEELSRRF